MKIAIVGYNLFGVGGTSRSNINLIEELLDVDDLEITYYNTRKIPIGAVRKFKKENSTIGDKIQYRHFTTITEDNPQDVYILTREILFVLSKIIKQAFPNALVIGEVHAPLPQIEPEIDLAKESIDVYRVATKRSAKNFLERIGEYHGEIVPFPVSVRHLQYDKKLPFHPTHTKNLYIYSRFDEFQKDISYAIRLMDYLVNYLGDKDFKLYLKGVGPSQTLYKNLISYYNLEENIFINEDIPNNAIYLSTARNETFGYSISEAFTAGKKVLLYGGDDQVIKDIYGDFRTFGWLSKNIESDTVEVQKYVSQQFTQDDFIHDIDEALKYSIKYNYGKAFISDLVENKEVLTYSGVETKEEIASIIYAYDTAAKTSLFSTSYNFVIKHIPGVKKLLTQEKVHGILRDIYGKVYKPIKIETEIRDDFAFIESFHGKSFAGDPKYMAFALKKRYPQMNIFVSSVNQMVDSEILSYGFVPVRLGSQEYIQKFQQSRYVITNGNALDKAGKRKGQRFIQTWHGLPLKKMVHDLENRKQREEESSAFLPRMLKWDYLLTSSSFNTDLLRSAFMLNQNKKLEILEFGAPRNGYLIANSDNRNEVDKLHQKYFNRPYDGKKYILYCPTWRKDERQEATKLNLKKVIENLPSEFEIIVKLHPLESHLRAQYANIDSRIYCFFNELVDIQELYLLSDMLITDFSSAMFDFAHLNRKIIILQEDAEDYSKKIGWYFDTKTLLEIEGKQYTEESLVQAILATGENFKYDKLIVEKLMNQDGPESADKIIDTIAIK